MEIEIPINARDEKAYEKEQKKATYANISSYIKEHYGICVSTSHIAQVKRSCGLDMRQCYNKSKKEEPAPTPMCPDIQAQYIKEALVYFEAII